MLDKLLQIVGVDLQAQLAQVTARANAFKETTKREVRAEIMHIGTVAAFGFAALVALSATCVIALVALYMWLKPEYGAPVALAIVGGITLLFGIVMMVMATTRAAPPTIAMPEPLVAPQPVAKPRPAPASPVNLAAMVAPPPSNASLFDVVAHRVSTRAAGMADEAIESAEDTIAHGSRTALVGTVAAAIFVGWIVGRRGGL
jgi:hypothetical protein